MQEIFTHEVKLIFSAFRIKGLKKNLLFFLHIVYKIQKEILFKVFIRAPYESFRMCFRIHVKFDFFSEFKKTISFTELGKNGSF